MKDKKILMIYIEPTPYIVGFILSVQAVWKGQIDVIFITENLSQDWNIEVNPDWLILSKFNGNKYQLFYSIFFKKNYTFVHLAGWGHPLLLFFILLAKCARIPIAIESDTSLPQYLKFWKRVVKRALYPSFFKMFHLFLPGGTRQAKYFEHYGVNSKKIFPACMTVDVKSIKNYASTLCLQDRLMIRKKYGIPENSILFLFVGRLVNYKGIVDLISAFNEIENENISLLVVGSGDLRQSVMDASEKNKKIHYAGRLSGDEVIKCYFAADVFVLPSHFEPWGLVINEAMALERPVIVSDCVGCLDDLVIPYETGLIFKTGCVNHLKQALEYMSNRASEREAMGKKALQKISNWTLENEAEKVCQAWAQLVNM